MAVNSKLAREQQIDGYVRLASKILGIPLHIQAYCRVCGVEIERSHPKGYICIDCYREQNSEKLRWYYLQHPDRIKATNKRWALKNPMAVRAGIIARYLYPITQKCSVNGCNRLAHRHHDDYNKPKEIKWLCSLHHKQVNRLLDRYGRI